MSSNGWETFSRQAPLELSGDGDGRTLIGRIVPYNVIAQVADPPDFRQYRETFAPGAFRPQLSAANRVLLNFEHRQGISDVIGRGVELQDQPDGLYGSFRVLDHADGDKALELVNAGVLRGMSTEFSVRKSRTVDGVVTRLDARIANVALCREYGSDYAGPKAAYEGAEVLAVRTDDPAAVVCASAPIPDDLQAKLAAVGVEPLPHTGVTRRPWDATRSRYTDEEWERACLSGSGSIPVLEPDGNLNVNALSTAAGQLRQGTTDSVAARQLLRYYRAAGLPAPGRIERLASL